MVCNANEFYPLNVTRLAMPFRPDSGIPGRFGIPIIPLPDLFVATHIISYVPCSLPYIIVYEVKS